MFKTTFIVFTTMLIVLMVTVFCSGCRAIPAFSEDVAGTFNAFADKTQKFADNANRKDAEADSKRLARYHSEQAGRFASYNTEEGK